MKKVRNWRKTPAKGVQRSQTQTLRVFKRPRRMILQLQQYISTTYWIMPTNTPFGCTSPIVDASTWTTCNEGNVEKRGKFAPTIPTDYTQSICHDIKLLLKANANRLCPSDDFNDFKLSFHARSVHEKLTAPRHYTQRQLKWRVFISTSPSCVLNDCKQLPILMPLRKATTKVARHDNYMYNRLSTVTVISYVNGKRWRQVMASTDVPGWRKSMLVLRLDSTAMTQNYTVTTTYVCFHRSAIVDRESCQT